MYSRPLQRPPRHSHSDASAPAGRASSYMPDLDVCEMRAAKEHRQQPEDDADDDNRVENLFHARFHRDERIHQPEQYPDNNKHDYERNERHGISVSERRNATASGPALPSLSVIPSRSAPSRTIHGPVRPHVPLPTSHPAWHSTSP